MKPLVALCAKLAIACLSVITVATQGSSSVFAEAYSRTISSAEAKSQTWPFVVDIGDRITLFKRECLGSLVHPQWVLTSVHYCKVYPGDLVNVGELMLDSFSEKNLYRVSEVAMLAERFDFGDGVPDLKLLKLDRPVEISEAVFPADLMSAKEFVQLYPLDARTLGLNRVRRPDRVHEVKVDLLRDHECNSEYLDPAIEVCGTIHSIPNAEESQNNCSGISGGPLFHTRSGRPQIIGVASWWRQGSCVSGGGDEQVVFAEVSAAYEWIIATIHSSEQIGLELDLLTDELKEMSRVVQNAKVNALAIEEYQLRIDQQFQQLLGYAAVDKPSKSILRRFNDRNIKRLNKRFDRIVALYLRRKKASTLKRQISRLIRQVARLKR